MFFEKVHLVCIYKYMYGRNIVQLTGARDYDPTTALNDTVRSNNRDIYKNCSS